jgi:FAD/FMN-containing dehydrogenase
MTTNGTLDALRAQLSGDLFTPDDAGYEEARPVYNAMFDKRPVAIARCATTADVVAAVNAARESGLEPAVRGGGHSVAGLSICDGLVIDLSGLKAIDVDPMGKTARAGGGALWGEFDKATQEHGLHTPGGRMTTTGLGGFTLNGGFGWTSSKYGLACDNLLAAEVVLADGSVVRASADENPELLWGLRGGGGNFGVVTELEMRLHPLGPIVLAGLALWPLARAGEVLRAWRDYVDDAPDELSTGAVMMTAPPEEFVPDHLKGQTALGIPAMWVGDPQEGASAMAPLKELGPEVDLIQPMPYTDFQALIDPAMPPGMRSYWRGEYMSSMPDAAIDTYLAHAPDLVTAGMPFTQSILFRVGQAVSVVPDDATAMAYRDARYMFHPITMWENPADDARLMADARAFAEAMRPFDTGHGYLNFTGEPDRVRDAYGDAKYERLVGLKDRYDPDNLFHLNPNIEPSRQAGAAAPA